MEVTTDDMQSIVDLVRQCEHDQNLSQKILMDVITYHPHTALESYRRQDASLCDVVLESWNGYHKIPTIKAIRALSGAGLAEAKHMTEGKYSAVLLRGVSRSTAKDLIAKADPDKLLNVGFVPAGTGEKYYSVDCSQQH